MSTSKADHANRQRRVLGIADKLLQHAAELRELADELDGLGCGCGRVADEQPYQHAATCAVRMAWSARNMARGHVGRRTPPPASKDVRHLTPPFRSPVGRATCSECDRYARHENQIPHADECSKKET